MNDDSLADSDVQQDEMLQEHGFSQVPPPMITKDAPKRLNTNLQKLDPEFLDEKDSEKQENDSNFTEDLLNSFRQTIQPSNLKNNEVVARDEEINFFSD